MSSLVILAALQISCEKLQVCPGYGDFHGYGYGMSKVKN